MRLESSFGKAVAAGVLLSCGGLWAGQSDSALKDARAMLEKRAEAERLISKETGDWELARQILEGRIAILEREILGLEAGVAEAAKNAQAAGSEDAQLAHERDSLRDAEEFLADRVSILERRFRDEVLPLLPDVLRRKSEKLLQRLPVATSESKPSLADRYRTVVGLLGEVDRFNGQVTVAGELRAVVGGGTNEVRALYLGLGQAFYANREKGVAGRGFPTEGGWKWEEMPAMAARIGRAIDAVEGASVREPVAVPVEIR